MRISLSPRQKHLLQTTMSNRCLQKELVEDLIRGSEIKVKGFRPFTLPFGVLTKKSDTVVLSFPPYCQVSRLPKALFRELSGRCSDPEGGSRHQIKTTTSTSLAQGRLDHQVGHRRDTHALPRSTRTTNSKPGWFACWSVFVSRPWARLFATCVRILNESKQLQRPRWMEIVKFDDSAPSQGSRADTRGFREGRQGRCEKPKQWDRRYCYSVHPYWTNNLKYVY